MFFLLSIPLQNYVYFKLLLLVLGESNREYYSLNLIDIILMCAVRTIIPLRKEFGERQDAASVHTELCLDQSRQTLILTGLAAK